MFVASPQSVSVREGVPEELPRSMAHLSRGTALRPLYNLLPYGEGVPEELPEVMARLLRGSTLWARPSLFPCERVRQMYSSSNLYRAGDK